MNKAPDRIWALSSDDTWQDGMWDLGLDDLGLEAEYIRADIYDADVATLQQENTQLHARIKRLEGGK